MSDIVISARGLGKSYLIGHKIDIKTTFRDRVTESVASVGRNLGRTLKGQQILAGNDIEEFWALKDVDFDIRRGEAVGIIGRNGAGKSTLLKIFSRITEPTTGMLKIRGRVASLLEVGTGFHPELTGRENIFLNGAILGMTRIEIRRRFDAIVDFAGVEKFLDTPVKRYSSGMYVRLAFAVAAHLEPEILVVDEVLAVGDAEFQRKCIGKMNDVAVEGRTVIFVSHNMAAIKRLCRSGVLLKAGSVVSSGNIEHVISAYSQLAPNEKTISLKDRFDRRGSGGVVINNVELKKEISNISVGEEISFAITAFNNVEDINVRPWLLFRNMYGDDILMVMPEANNSFKISGPSLLECRFECPLAPGFYSLAIGLLSNHGAILDWVDDVVKIEVSNEFSSGRPYDGRLGATTLTGQWKMYGKECNA